MRAAFVHPFLFRYARGIERYTFNLANALARQNVQVDILTWRWDKPIQTDALDTWVRVWVMPTARYFAAQAVVPFYLNQLRRGRYDYVWIFFAGYGEAEALALARGQRFGIVLHYPYEQVPHRYREFRRYGLAKRAADIVAVSRYVADGAREALGRASTVIHHGVDTSRFKPDAMVRARVRGEWGTAPGAPLLVTAAALEERKGMQYVLAALPAVREEFPDVRYVIAGEGPYRGALEAQIQALGLGGCVELRGAQADTAPLYQAADAALILARGEASSLTALEAMACELPVIAARRQPLDELVTPECGVLVEETDAGQVSAAIRALLASPEQRREMGRAGRERVRNEFTWERAAEQYAALMEAGRDA